MRGHGGPPLKSLDSDENSKPKHTLFCRELRFVAIYALFGDLWAKKHSDWTLVHFADSLSGYVCRSQSGEEMGNSRSGIGFALSAKYAPTPQCQSSVFDDKVSKLENSGNHNRRRMVTRIFRSMLTHCQFSCCC